MKQPRSNSSDDDIDSDVAAISNIGPDRLVEVIDLRSTSSLLVVGGIFFRELRGHRDKAFADTIRDAVRTHHGLRMFDRIIIDEEQASALLRPRGDELLDIACGLVAVVLSGASDDKLATSIEEQLVASRSCARLWTFDVEGFDRVRTRVVVTDAGGRPAHLWNDMLLKSREWTRTAS